MDNQKQKGMTLIEVMVAMLVLSIAMIGGISFFTSAYRINYTYMESANRIDHALRYVEKLKIQRRDYPTFGAFANIGGNGFTAFFVDSEFNDNYAADPYFFEEYFPGTIKIPATFTTITNFPYTSETTIINGVSHPIGYYYWGEAYKVKNSTYAYMGDLVGEDFPKNDYHKRRISLAFSGASDTDTHIKVGTSGVVDYYLSYKYYPESGDEDSHAYSETTFAKMANYSKGKKTSYSYDNDRKLAKYIPNTNISGMISTSNINFHTFPTGSDSNINEGTVDCPTTGRHEVVSKTDTHGGYFTAPYSYLSVYGGSNDTKASGRYSHSSKTSNPIVLQNGTVQENTGESSSIIGKEGYTFDSRRFYRSSPSMANQDEISELRDDVQSVYTTSIERPYDDINKDVLDNPDPDLIGNTNLYHKDAKYIALVFKGNATGKIQIHNLYTWSYLPGSEGNPSSVTPYDNKTNAANFKLAPGGINNHRVTRYRRSSYISLWPFESDASARALMRNAIASSQNFNARVNYIKNHAKTTGKSMIVIPFIQLYADDNNSTLCEAL